MHHLQTGGYATTRRSVRGFTLIEVLIVVAIIGILAAIAYPSYGSYVEKTRRADGHLALLQEVQNLERCKATNYSFTGCTLASTSSPEDYYTISLASTATGYTITATGKGPQANDTDCRVMTINHQDIRTPDDTTPADGDDAPAQCWPN